MAVLISLFSVAVLLTRALPFSWRQWAFLKITCIWFLLLISVFWASDIIYKPYPLYSLWGRWNCTLSGQTDCLGFISPFRMTELKLEQLSNTLSVYQHSCGQFPSTQNGLESLVYKKAPCQSLEVSTRLFPEDLIDGWGYSIQYISDGKGYTLRSLGRDGQEGGDGENADITWSDSSAD